MNNEATFGGAMASVLGLVIRSANAAGSVVATVDNLARAGEMTSQVFLEKTEFNVKRNRAINNARLLELEEQIKAGTLPGVVSAPLQLEA